MSRNALRRSRVLLLILARGAALGSEPWGPTGPVLHEEAVNRVLPEGLRAPKEEHMSRTTLHPPRADRDPRALAAILGSEPWGP